MAEVLDADTEIVRADELLSAETGEGRTVVMSVQQGMYYGMNEVAARIFELTREPISMAAICDAVTAEFAVDRSQCEHDVSRYLWQLADRGLVELRHVSRTG